MFFKRKCDPFETAHPCKQHVPTTETYFDCVNLHVKSNKDHKKPYKTMKPRKISTAFTNANLSLSRPAPLKRGKGRLRKLSQGLRDYVCSGPAAGRGQVCPRSCASSEQDCASEHWGSHCGSALQSACSTIKR